MVRPFGGSSTRRLGFKATRVNGEREGSFRRPRARGKGRREKGGRQRGWTVQGRDRERRVAFSDRKCGRLKSMRKAESVRYRPCLDSTPKKLKTLPDFVLHRILRHMHEVLNIDKKNN